jgi:hypothetical protein
MLPPVTDLPIVGHLLAPRPGVVRTEHKTVHGWKLEIRDDSFAGRTTCVIARRRIQLAHGVVTFRFGGGVDTTFALFRLDGGSPQTAQSVAPAAAALGAALRGPDLSNPSGGLVQIPEAALQPAQAVSIRPNARSTSTTFRLDGLADAKAAAAVAGCERL